MSPGKAPAAMPLSRRELLAAGGRAVAAGVVARLAGPAAQASARTPFSLIIDDGSPVDPLFYELPGYETPFLVPLDFTRHVIEVFDRFDLRGKFTIIPMPSCLGRIDKSLQRVPPEHLAAFLKLVREGIAPRFDITPEFLTHMRAYDLRKTAYQHIYEDAWISTAPLEEIVEYFVLAFQILQNVGLPATGITSPWSSGIDVEKKYAQALGEAQWKVFQRKRTWYFLHSVGWGDPRRCSVEYQAPERGQVVVSVPANGADIFWSMEQPTAAGTDCLHQRRHRPPPLAGWPHGAHPPVDGVGLPRCFTDALAVALHPGYRPGPGRARDAGRTDPQSLRRFHRMGAVLGNGAALRRVVRQGRTVAALIRPSTPPVRGTG